MEHTKKTAGAFLSGVALATAIGGYFLFISKDAKKNKHTIENWIEDAKDDVMSKVKKVKKISKNKYEEIVDEVHENYSKMKGVSKEKVDVLRDKLKSRWEEMVKEASEDAQDK